MISPATVPLDRRPGLALSRTAAERYAVVTAAREARKKSHRSARRPAEAAGGVAVNLV
jgi:hypothetical protein